MRLWVVVSILSAAALPSLAQAQDMRLDIFLDKADRLESRGPLALFSSDLGLLEDEVKASAAIYRQRVESDRDAGRPPHSCPPAEGGVRLGSDELLAHFREYPAPRRPAITVRRAFFDMMARKFPCG